MDIERIIEFDWAKFKVEIPSKTKSNIINGYYIKDKYDAQLFYELIQHGKIVRYKDYLVCNRFIIDLKTDSFVFFPSNNSCLYEEDEIYIRWYNRNDHIYSLRGKYYFSEITYRCYIETTFDIEEKLRYDWTIDLRKEGRIDPVLLVKAIQKVIDEKNEEGSQNDCTQIQKECLEVF